VLKMARVTGIIAAVLLLALAGCAAPKPQVVSREVPVERVVVETVVVEKAVEVAEARPPSPPDWSGAYDDSTSVDERMIIRTGDLTLVVGDTAVAAEQITSIVANLQGFVVNSNAWHEGKYTRARMMVKVPAQSFDAAMAQMKALANVIEQESTSGQDVTEEYSDLDAQLVNLEAAEKELRELLTQVRERTGKAEDILAVYRELTNIRGQIERIKGRMQYLGRMVAMATINIELRPDIVAEPLAGGRWRPSATVAKALQRLVDALKFIVDALIWIILFAGPVLVILALPLIALLLLIRWWRRRRKSEAEQ